MADAQNIPNPPNSKPPLSLYVWDFYNGNNPCTFIQVSDSVESILKHISNKRFPETCDNESTEFINRMGPYASIRTEVTVQKEKKEIERQRRNRKETKEWAEMQMDRRSFRIGFTTNDATYSTLYDFLKNTPPSCIRRLFTPIIFSALIG